MRQPNRETAPYYISATDEDIDRMLEAVGASRLEDMFAHIPDDISFKHTPRVCEPLSHGELLPHLTHISEKNNILHSFLGDGLRHFRTHDIVPFVSSIRGLTTAYTPYQPERSQGTLHSLWIYACAISSLTGFEAIGSGFYDRSTALFEALKTAVRIAKTKKTVMVSGGIYPGDLEALLTHAQGTAMNIAVVPMDKTRGILDTEALSRIIERHRDDLAAFAFAQTNHFGNIERFHSHTDICRREGIASVALVDPLLNADGGLVPPSLWGSEGRGTTMFVGEGQHLCLGPNYGGPGLGIFGIRFNDEDKHLIRHTAGRFVGKAQDKRGRDCFCMVLSTREQHIRRQRATSNICSNQSFVATLVGASLLSKGASGLKKTLEKTRANALRGFRIVTAYEGFRPAFDRQFFDECTFRVPIPTRKLLASARGRGIHLGVDVGDRGRGELLMMSFSDIQEEGHFRALDAFLGDHFKKKPSPPVPPKRLEKTSTRTAPVEGLADLPIEEIKKFYLALGAQNVSPDDDIYPLGSCTMKYNPLVNDRAASLSGFADLHPQVPEEDAQGALEILYGIQEFFKAITGLAGTAIQPVAGAQGELAGLKMFQAYHRDRGEDRNVVLIPKNAHGTNPATATMAGFPTDGILEVPSNDRGEIHLDELKRLVEAHAEDIAGVMITNPNTAGIFENSLSEIAQFVHSAGGLVYMDGANMNAIASQVDLGRLGVDAVHNNLHKTWSIPHGGGGPGDAVVCVGERLLPYIPGIQIRRHDDGLLRTYRAERSIGSLHRHFGNFAHKVRAYTYLRALGSPGIRKMSAFAVLSARYLYEAIRGIFPTLPEGCEEVPRMHEFIITLAKEGFEGIDRAGTPRAQAIAKIGKLFSDFGLHAPTVAFPERFGLMIEPTESYTKGELDRFVEVLKTLAQILEKSPEVLKTAPHFTPVAEIREVEANRNLVLSETITGMPTLAVEGINPKSLRSMDVADIRLRIVEAHRHGRSRP